MAVPGTNLDASEGVMTGDEQPNPSFLLKKLNKTQLSRPSVLDSSASPSDSPSNAVGAGVADSGPNGGSKSASVSTNKSPNVSSPSSSTPDFSGVSPEAHLAAAATHIAAAKSKLNVNAPVSKEADLSNIRKPSALQKASERDVNNPEVDQQRYLQPVSSKDAQSIDTNVSVPSASKMPSTSGAEIGALTPDNKPAVMPTLENQQPSSAIGRFFSRTQPSPTPGSEYKEASASPFQKTAGVASKIGTVLSSVYGNAAQRQYSQELPMRAKQMELELAALRNEQAYRTGMLGVNQEKAATGRENAETRRDLAAVTAHKQMLVMNPDGSTRVPTADEILNDPEWSQDTQMKQAALGLKAAQQSNLDERTKYLHDPLNPDRQIKMKYADLALQKMEEMFMMQRANLQARLQGLAIQGAGLNLRQGEEGMKIAQPALDAEQRLKVMRRNYQDGLGGNQQAQLSLLANHLGMTSGLQKGMRIQKAMWDEAAQSTPWIQSILARFTTVDPTTGDRIVTSPLRGVALAPDQMKQMLELAEDRYRTSVSSFRESARTLSAYGIPTNEPSWELNPDEPMPTNELNAPSGTQVAMPKNPIFSAVASRNKKSNNPVYDPATGKFSNEK